MVRRRRPRLCKYERLALRAHLQDGAAHEDDMEVEAMMDMDQQAEVAAQEFNRLRRLRRRDWLYGRHHHRNRHPNQPRRRRKPAYGESKTHKKKRFRNIFGFTPESNKQYLFLDRLVKETITADNAHVRNFSNVEIPLKFQCLLFLGLKFCLPGKINRSQMTWYLKSSMRRMSWRIFYMRNPRRAGGSNNPRPIQIWSNAVKKYYAKQWRVQLNLDPDFDRNFDLITLIETIFWRVENNFRYTPEWCLVQICQEFKRFCHTNSICIIEADKNAGFCIVNKDDYNVAVLAFLNNIQMYETKTEEFVTEQLLHYKNRFYLLYREIFQVQVVPKMFNDIPIEAASFHVLLKLHKTLVNNFPPVRPIASTINKTNRPAASLLNFVLGPCINHIEDLLFDSNHLILLLNSLERRNVLDPTRTYAMVTLDVVAMYPNLDVTECKERCYQMYELARNRNPVQLIRRNIYELMDLALDYSYVKFGDNYYLQNRGIEMGNIASPLVANITLFYIFREMFQTKREIVFYKRYLDDLFLIIDTTEMCTSIRSWLAETIRHGSLSFTYKINFNRIQFLNLMITKYPGYSFSTSLMRRSESRTLHLHMLSNHTPSNKTKLYFAAGLRVVRGCTEYTDRYVKLEILASEFIERGYNRERIQSDFMKLVHYNRRNALKPKTKLFIEYLLARELEIVQHYELTAPNPRQFANNHPVRVVVPYVAQVPDVNDIVARSINEQLRERVEEGLVRELNFSISNCRVRNLGEFLHSRL